MKLFQKIVPAVLCLSLLCFSPSVQAASSSSLPQQVVSDLGFLSGVTLSEPVTRAQFAQILLNASSYQGNAGTTVAYNPVSYTHLSSMRDAASLPISVRGSCTVVSGGL